MKEDNEARFRVQGEGGIRALTPSTTPILAVFGLAFVVMMDGVIPRRSLLVPFTP